MIEMILFEILLAVYYLYFLYGIYNGLKNLANKKSKSCSKEKSVTLIIPFRNESKNILNSLSSIQSQKYPKTLLEVIYVNDYSEDDSVEKLRNNISCENIQILNNDNVSERGHKKSSIELGIKHAKNDLIVITDADCVHDAEWINAIISEFDEDTGFISGPVEFYSDGTLFQSLQKLEFSSLIISGAGLIGSGNPIICNSANLAFRKNLFFQVGGYNDNKHISSGDDEFLMRKIVKLTNYKVKFCTNSKSIVKTLPNNSLGSFMQQRKRWASKGLYSNDYWLTIKLILIFLFYVLFPVNVLLSLFVNEIFILLLAATFTLKCLSEYLVMAMGQRVIFGKTDLKHFFTAQIFQIPYIVFASLLGLFGNYSWKNRKVKR